MARKWWKKRSAKEEEAHQSALNKELDLLDSEDEGLKTPSTSTASATSSGWWCLPFPRRRRAGRAETHDMKKFGFGKKPEGDGDDRNRTGLFGRKKPSPQDDNPYAQQPAEDPYARLTPYQQARANLAAGPQGPRPGAAGLPSGPGPRSSHGTPPPSYHGSPQIGSGYAPDKLGAAGGYGSNRYDADPSAYGPAQSTASLPSQRLPSRGPGGYGGLGSTDEANRDALLAGARPPPKATPLYSSTSNNDFDAPSTTASSSGDGYGEERELTQEELEKKEYHDIKNQIDDTLTQGVNSLDNSLRLVDDILQTGSNTLANLAGQHERLYSTQKNLDLAKNQHRVATDKTKELKTLSGSMFRPHVSNPFTSKARQAEHEEKVLQRHVMERENREAIRKNQYGSTQNMERTFQELARPAAQTNVLLGAKATSARSKYATFDDGSDDEWVESQTKKEQVMDKQMALLLDKTKRINILARAQGQEVDSQNKLINDLQHDTDDLDSGLRVTRERLRQIH